MATNYTTSAFPAPPYRLPHRVTVTPVRTLSRDIAAYRCPGCTHTWRNNRARVADLAYWHAARCEQLRALNRRALTCWNCEGAGHIDTDPSWCVVCLGRGWTTTPDPTTRRHP